MHVSVFNTNVFSPRSNCGNEKTNTLYIYSYKISIHLRVVLISNYIYNDIDVDDMTNSNNSAFNDVCQISVKIASWIPTKFKANRTINQYKTNNFSR